MKNIRKAIRKEFFKLFENYPAGTVNDPSSPWNQSDPKHLDVRKPQDELYKTIYFEREITILKKALDNSKWFFYNDSVEKNDYLPYSGAEDRSVFTGNDEDGQPTFDEEYDWTLDGQIVQDYINDNTKILATGFGVQGYEDGKDLVKIDQNLAVELTNTYKNENLKKILFLP